MVEVDRGRGTRLTSADVARLAGVSQATVSRVLNGSASVSPQRRAQVLRALEQSGYRRDALAAAMKTGRTGTIAVVVSDIRNPFYPELLAPLGARFAAADHRMILWETDAAGEELALSAIREGLVDALVIATAMPGSASLHEAIQRRFPVVLVNRTIAGAGCDQVSSDNVAGAMEAARHLLQADRTNIAMIGGPSGASTAHEREEGLRSVVDATPGARCEVLRGDFSHATAHRIARDLLTRAEPPLAIFCVNDLTAFGVLDAARSLGVQVPDDLWVIGFDDIPMAAWESFDLTSIRQPIGEMAAEAVSMLLGRLGGESHPFVHRRFPCELVVRGTTGVRA